MPHIENTKFCKIGPCTFKQNKYQIFIYYLWRIWIFQRKNERITEKKQNLYDFHVIKYIHLVVYPKCKMYNKIGCII